MYNFDDLLDRLETYGDKAGTEAQLDQTTEILRLAFESYLEPAQRRDFLRAVNQDLNDLE